MATSSQTAQRGKRSGGRRGSRRNQKPKNGRNRRKYDDQEGIIPVLARAVREVEHAVKRGRVTTTDRNKFQVVALLAREERSRVKEADSLDENRRDVELKRVEGIAAILAQIAASHPTFFELLQDDAEITAEVRALRRDMRTRAGLEVAPEPAAVEDADEEPEVSEHQVRPALVTARQLSDPFMAPNFDNQPPRVQSHLLASWELIGPLLNAFEHPAPGASSCMELPEIDPATIPVPEGLELMPHQVGFVGAAREGHRTFLLADEPGLGKTAQALLAAEAAQAFPLLCVVPNVVKVNWAREVEKWIPRRRAAVVHGDAKNLDAFADVIIVNYEVLDRHVEWMGELGFRGMVVDEAHFIKNKKSQRSQHVRAVADRIRERAPRPLMMALTGTPLINDIEDFRAIWEFLGWIDDKKPLPILMARLEENGFTPADHAFYPAARQTVVDLGVVRRRKVEVAADIPARRIADMPVELEGSVGQSVRAAEARLAQRLMDRYDAALLTRAEGAVIDSPDGIDHDLVARIASWELADGNESGEGSSGENVFTMVRHIGQAKAPLAADFAAQLVLSVGKVVFFAKHIDVMDQAAEHFANQGIGYATIRGDQTTEVRQRNVDAFTNDPEVKIIICSLTAAGVGINLQASSNVVLAELSWTDAEQTQAIDRVHRIGQTEPVTAWRIIAAQTLDARIAELIDRKAGLAATALDGATDMDLDVDVQLEALISLLTHALTQRQQAQPA